MSNQPDISVIIVSRDRPVELRKMLACLRFQDISGFEVIVVTNTPGALEGALLPKLIRLFDCDEANIAVARNVGLAAAKGRYVAFCDDDALPDPSWLRHLLGPFKNANIGGTGGFTRGRNGISLQWAAVETDCYGVAHPLDIAEGSDPVIFNADSTRAPVMIGTNCAFRASALRQIGGFDPAFAYFLDDSDISLRLSQTGWKLAIVPKAQVHHGFAAGPYRAANRVPKTLQPHGKSKAYFCRKHGREEELGPALRAFKSLQIRRLEEQMLAGLMEPQTLTALIKSLEKGYTTGRHCPLATKAKRPNPPVEAAPEINRAQRTHVMLVGRKSDQKWIQKTGETLAKNDIVVTGLTLSHTLAFMQVTFSALGFWQHKGGQFGKSARNEPFVRRTDLKTKARSEAARLRTIRPVDLLVFAEQAGTDATIKSQTGDMSCINGFVVESV